MKCRDTRWLDKRISDVGREASIRIFLVCKDNLAEGWWSIHRARGSIVSIAVVFRVKLTAAFTARFHPDH